MKLTPAQELNARLRDTSFETLKVVARAPEARQAAQLDLFAGAAAVKDRATALLIGTDPTLVLATRDAADRLTSKDAAHLHAISTAIDARAHSLQGAVIFPRVVYVFGE